MVGTRGAKLLRRGRGCRRRLRGFYSDCRIAAHLHLAEGYVSRAFRIRPNEFFIATRGPRKVAEARQLVMYLAHVEFGMPLSAVGHRYLRDRTTASHACKTIENRRENPIFDELVSEIEKLITLRTDTFFDTNLRFVS